MRLSLGLRSASFALRSQRFALVGHVVFSFFDCPFPSAGAVVGSKRRLPEREFWQPKSKVV
jgi:hypothetical protein